MKKLIQKLHQKTTQIAIQTQTRAMEFAQDRSGSETTEKIGMVVVAIVIVGLLAAAVNAAMPGLFNSIFQKAQQALEGIF